jgi:hypothetical protein
MRRLFNLFRSGSNLLQQRAAAAVICIFCMLEVDVDDCKVDDANKFHKNVADVFVVNLDIVIIIIVLTSDFPCRAFQPLHGLFNNINVDNVSAIDSDMSIDIVHVEDNVDLFVADQFDSVTINNNVDCNDFGTSAEVVNVAKRIFRRMRPLMLSRCT